MAPKNTEDRLRTEERERLYPSLTNPSWLVLRERRRLLERWLQRLPRGPNMVLDVGGRIQPYRRLIEVHSVRYLAVDIRATVLVDIVARGEQLPLRDGQFNVVICTQVLEYIAQPQQVIAEIHRVLKPGGFLFVTVPAVFPRDSDHDAWRFMPEGLRHLLKPFSAVEIVAEGSSIIGFFRTLAVISVSFAKPAPLAKLLRWTLVPFLNLTAVLMASLVKTNNDQFSANFAAFAQK